MTPDVAAPIIADVAIDCVTVAAAAPSTAGQTIATAAVTTSTPMPIASFPSLVSYHGVLLIRELPDTVKLKETEAEAYCAVWDIMVELEKNLPMAFVFYGQDTLGKQGMRYDELGIFLPDSLLMKNLERHVAKAEAIIYAEK